MTLFKEIYTDINQKIINGTYKRGSVLPSEGELQKKYAVSRTTIRKSIELLVKEKKVIRKKGVGLFVYPEISKQNILDMTGIIRPSYIEEPENTRIKDAYLRKAGVYYANIFDIKVNELIYYISFLITSSEGKTYVKLILPLDFFPGFDPHMLKVTPIIEAINTGLYRVIDVYQEFQLIEGTDEDNRQLNIASGDPIFKITNTFLDDYDKNIAVEYKMQSALQTKYSINFD